MGKFHLALPLVVLFGLAGCGSSESDQDRIAGNIETALVKTDPRSCTALMTQAYLEQSFGTEGPSALESCESNARAEESNNPPVEVTKVKVHGARATADVAAANDQTFRVALVEEGGDWKLDEMVRLVKFNRNVFLREERKGLESGEDQPDPKVARCILRNFREMSRSEIEEILLGGSSEGEIEIFERCHWE